jgi:hypothetical protein
MSALEAAGARWAIDRSKWLLWLVRIQSFCPINPKKP